MKILFLSDNFPPEINAPASRTYDHCLEWVKKGAEVTVITCFPNFPKGEIFEGYKNSLYKKETINGIKVIRVWSFIAPNSGFFKRSIDFLSYGLMSFIVGCFQSFDIVIGTSPQFFAATSAFFISICRSKPWIMEVRDLWPDTIVTLGSLKRNDLIFKILKGIEIFLYNKANSIVVVTKSYKQYMIDLGISAKKIHIVYNGYNKKAKSVLNKEHALEIRKQMNIKKKFLVSYIGTHGLAHGLEFIIESIVDYDKSFHFLFIGEGAKKEKIVKKAKKLKLTNVTFKNLIPKDEVAKYLNATDFSLVNLIKSDDYKHVIPSKIFESAAFYNPIILGVEGEAKELIEKYNIGMAFEPQNKNSFLEVLEKIKSYKSNYFNSNCDKLIKDFDRKYLALQMYNIIYSTLNK